MSATEYTAHDGTRYRRTDDGGIESYFDHDGLGWYAIDGVSACDVDAVASLLPPKYATPDNADMYAQQVKRLDRDTLETWAIAAMLHRDVLALETVALRNAAEARIT